MERYGMDTEVWRKCQRHIFPYNARLETIVGLPLIIPLLYLGVNVFQTKTYKEGITLAQTLAVSVVGYMLTDRLILAFKDTLA